MNMDRDPLARRIADAIDQRAGMNDDISGRARMREQERRRGQYGARRFGAAQNETLIVGTGGGSGSLTILRGWVNSRGGIDVGRL
jgi:hypothetical protein